MSQHDNTAGDRPTFVSHLECSKTGERHAAGRLHNLSSAGFPLLVRYDLERMASEFTREQLAGRPSTCGATVKCCPSPARRTSFRWARSRHR